MIYISLIAQWNKKRRTNRFTGAASKVEGSTGRVGKGTAIIYDPRVENIRRDYVLEVLHKLYTPIPVLDLGVEN